jgi:hypothetical protein
LRQTKPPTGMERIAVSARTRRRSSSDKPCAHRALTSAACADMLGAVRFMVMLISVPDGAPHPTDGACCIIAPSSRGLRTTYGDAGYFD